MILINVGFSNRANRIYDGYLRELYIMSTFTIDQCHAALDRLIEKHSQLTLSDANEAETRLKVIDKVLREVLGWQDDDLSVEERCSEDSRTVFADYIVRTATTSLIVEAKKAGATFLLPTSQRSGKLGGALKEGEMGERLFARFEITAA